MGPTNTRRRTRRSTPWAARKFTWCASRWAAPLALCGTTATGRTAPDDEATGVVVDASLAAGASLASATSFYTVFESEHDPDAPLDPDFDDVLAGAPYFAVDTSVGAHVSSWFVMSGLLRAGVAGAPSPFTGEQHREPFWLVGPKLLYRPWPAGYHLGASGGLLGHHGYGWGASLSTGWDTPMPSGWKLGFGFELSTMWSRMREEGDHGFYTYDNRLLTTSFLVSFCDL